MTVERGDLGGDDRIMLMKLFKQSLSTNLKAFFPRQTLGVADYEFHAAGADVNDQIIVLSEVKGTSDTFKDELRLFIPGNYLDRNTGVLSNIRCELYAISRVSHCTGAECQNGSNCVLIN